MYRPSDASSITFVDFETTKILPRPSYPPKPVGFSLLEPGKPPVYYAWGHPTGNNCTYEKAHAVLAHIWRDPKRVVGFYNAKFDLDVADTHMGLPWLPAERIDDTLVLAVFKDARLPNHQQKNLLKVWLKKEQAERDELQTWILANCKDEIGKKKSQWGAYISKAPGDLVGRSRAIPDVLLTRELREYLHEYAESMSEPYLRELRLMRVLVKMEKRGVPMDVEKLDKDYHTYTHVLTRLDQEIKEYVDMPESESIDGDNFADYLQKFRRPDVGWPVTAKGKLSTSAEAIDVTLADRKLFGMVQYYGVLSTAVATFIHRWCTDTVDGRFHVSWNALKGEYGLGAKTGRLSSNPNLQNLLTIDTCEKVEKDLPEGYPLLPRLRQYIVAPKGYVIIGRDWNQQEYRTFAHYAEGKLAEGYRADPWMDIHVFVMEMINEIASTSIKRKETKTLNFGTLYGLGVKKLALKLKVDLDTARGILDAYFTAFPETKQIRNQMDAFDRQGLPIQTLGGRIYYAEEPKIVQGAYRRFGYKMVNLLVQGSCGDMCKQSMIEYDEDPDAEGELMLSVHDELASLVEEGARQRELAIMKSCMEERTLKLDVPLLSEGYYGHNFQDLIDLERGQ